MEGGGQSPKRFCHRPCFGLYTDQLMHTEVPPGLLLLLLLLVQDNAAELFLKAYVGQLGIPFHDLSYLLGIFPPANFVQISGTLLETQRHYICSAALDIYAHHFGSTAQQRPSFSSV